MKTGQEDCEVFFPFRIFHHCHKIDYANKCKLILFKHDLESPRGQWKVLDGGRDWRFLLNHAESVIPPFHSAELPVTVIWF